MAKTWTSDPKSTTNERIKYTITITQNSQSISNNTSNVTVSVRFYRTNTGYTTYGTGTVYCRINGTTYTAAVTSDQKITSSGINLFTKTLNISHNGDGTKTLETSAWITHTQFSATTQSFNQVLDTIPRATTPSLSTVSPTIGTSITITLNRASTSFTHTLKYTFGTLSGTIGTGIATSKTWIVPSSFASQIPSGTSGQGTIICETYNGSNLVGSKSITFTASLSSGDVPTIGSVTITEATEGIASKFHAFIQGKSALNVAINASPSTGASITSYTTYIQAQQYSGQSFTSNLITSSGNIGVRVIVKDSRGKTADQTFQVTILPYSAPTISKLMAYRVNSSGVAADDGTYLKVEYQFSITTLNNLNDKSFTIEYKTTSSDTWTTLTSGSVYSANTSIRSSTAILSVDSAYDVRLTQSDYFSDLSVMTNVSTAFTLVDYRSTGKGMAIGKVSEKDGLEVAMDSEFTGKVNILAQMPDVADSEFVRLKHPDGSLSALLATSDDGDGLNLHFYQDDAWSGVVKFMPDGTIPPSSISSMVDFVVEEGASDIWSYRKWNSGIAECWGTKEVTVTVTGAWGNLFTSAPITDTNVDFPFTFAEVPTLNVNLTGKSVGGFIMVSGGSAQKPTTVSETGTFEICRGTAVSTNSTYKFNYHAIGKWK